MLWNGYATPSGAAIAGAAPAQLQPSIPVRDSGDCAVFVDGAGGAGRGSDEQAETTASTSQSRRDMTTIENPPRDMAGCGRTRAPRPTQSP
jgi:hypothetical protein